MLQKSVFALNSSIPVELTVPDTILQVDGKAAPNSIVSVKESGSIIASALSDSLGNFTSSISTTIGLHKIDVSYTDITGQKSAVHTYSISVQPQKTNFYNVFLAPTISRSTPQLAKQGSIVQLRGYSFANSIVNLSLDYSIKSYTTIAAANGFYEFLINSEQLSATMHIANVSSVIGAENSLISNYIDFNVVSVAGATAPDLVVSPEQLPPPQVISPENNTVIDGDSAVISGESVPSAQINIYENGSLYGSIFADFLGKWTFIYKATFSPVTLSFEACINGSCSVQSNTLTLTFTGIDKQCKLEFELNNYRFWDILKNQEIYLDPKNVSSEGVIDIHWGDEVIERFNYSTGETQKLTHKYSTKGNYNGKIIYRNRIDDISCQKVRYFSVLVTQELSNSDINSLFLLALLVIGFLGLNYVAAKEKQKTVQNK